MLPKAIPELTKEQFKFLEIEMQRKPSKEDIALFKEAKAIYKKYPVK